MTKILAKEEVLNLFYQYRNAPFYPDIQEHLLTAESIILLLTNSKDTIPAKDEGDEDIKLESPVVRWKKMIGNKDPDEAKLTKYGEANNLETLRSGYGVDLIKNGFTGDDDSHQLRFVIHLNGPEERGVD